MSPVRTPRSMRASCALLLVPALTLVPTSAPALESPFQPPTVHPLDVLAYDASIGDLNGDGAVDIALILPYSPDGVSSVGVLPGLRTGRPGGTFGPLLRMVPELPPDGPNGPPRLGEVIVAGRFTGTERADLAFVSTTSYFAPRQYVCLMKGAPSSFLTPAPVQTEVQTLLRHGIITSLVAADFNEDRILDLVCGYSGVSSAAGPALEPAFGTGDGRFAPGPRTPLNAAASRIVASDLDDDGHVDLAAAFTSVDRVEVRRGLGNGSFELRPHLTTGPRPRGLVAVDLNGDRLLDLVASNSYGGTVSVFMANRSGPGGSLAYGPGTLWSNGARLDSYPFSLGPGSIVAADWNLDGAQDLAVANDRDATVGILYGRGDGTFAAPVVIPVGRWPWDLEAADLNADGGPDLVVLCRESWRVEVHLNVNGNQPPDCSGALAVVPVVWPPNGELMPVGIVGVTDPDGDPVTITVTGVTQDEPVAGPPRGTCPDALVVDGAALVRSERAGSGNGRVYAVAFEASDGRGGTCTGSVNVCIPHDQGAGAMCVDDGQTLASTAACGPATLADPETRVEVAAVGTGTVRFAVTAPRGSRAVLAIYDVTGRRVARLEAAPRTMWDRSDAPAGLYFAVLSTGRARAVTRFVLAR